MRVIKDGVEMQVRCRSCKSILAILPEDVRDCCSIGTVVNCAVCNKSIPVPCEKMSPLFKQRVNWDESL
jgi:hypothetical protein